MDKIEKKTNRGGFVLKFVAGSAVAALVFFLGFDFIAGKLNRSNVVVDSLLTKASAEMNKNLPMLIGAGTRLNSTEALPGKKIVYNNTMVNYEYTEADDKNIED